MAYSYSNYYSQSAYGRRDYYQTTSSRVDSYSSGGDHDPWIRLSAREGRFMLSSRLHANMTLAEIIGQTDDFGRCLGYAHTAGRRCLLTAPNSRATGRSLLAEGEQLFREGRDLGSLLHGLAYDCLCTRWHKRYASTIKEAWEDRIEEHRRLFPRARSRAPTRETRRSRAEAPRLARPRAVSPPPATRIPSLTVPSSHVRSSSHGGAARLNSHRDVLRRTVEGDCHICSESMLDNTPVVWCRQQCGYNYHRRCIISWDNVCMLAGRTTTCPVCRTPWRSCPSTTHPPPARPIVSAPRLVPELTSTRTPANPVPVPSSSSPSSTRSSSRSDGAVLGRATSQPQAPTDEETRPVSTVTTSEDEVPSSATEHSTSPVRGLSSANVRDNTTNDEDANPPATSPLRTSAEAPISRTSNRTRDFSHLHATVEDDPADDTDEASESTPIPTASTSTGANSASPTSTTPRAPAPEVAQSSENVTATPLTPPSSTFTFNISQPRTPSPSVRPASNATSSRDAPTSSLFTLLSSPFTFDGSYPSNRDASPEPASNNNSSGRASATWPFAPSSSRITPLSPPLSVGAPISQSPLGATRSGFTFSRLSSNPGPLPSSTPTTSRFTSSSPSRFVFPSPSLPGAAFSGAASNATSANRTPSSSRFTPTTSQYTPSSSNFSFRAPSSVPETASSSTAPETASAEADEPSPGDPERPGAEVSNEDKPAPASLQVQTSSTFTFSQSQPACEAGAGNESAVTSATQSTSTAVRGAAPLVFGSPQFRMSSTFTFNTSTTAQNTTTFVSETSTTISVSGPEPSVPIEVAEQDPSAIDEEPSSTSRHDSRDDSNDNAEGDALDSSDSDSDDDGHVSVDEANDSAADMVPTPSSSSAADNAEVTSSIEIEVHETSFSSVTPDLPPEPTPSSEEDNASLPPVPKTPVITVTNMDNSSPPSSPPSPSLPAVLFTPDSSPSSSGTMQLTPPSSPPQIQITPSPSARRKPHSRHNSRGGNYDPGKDENLQTMLSSIITALASSPEGRLDGQHMVIRAESLLEAEESGSESGSEGEEEDVVGSLEAVEGQGDAGQQVAGLGVIRAIGLRAASPAGEGASVEGGFQMEVRLGSGR